MSHELEVLKATTCAIEAVHVSFTHAPSRDNAPFVPIHHVPNQDNTPFVLVHPVPGQDNDPSIPIDHVPNQNSAQRSRKRQSMSAMPTESIVNWVVSKKQGLNERFDKQYYTHKELKFNFRLKIGTAMERQSC
ncbi:hypothetical protein V6N11_079827 [Hibiscus sabdariffa]|uniref:Uncharacterized protein n=1 Tax=Hibiscus sabdariffa TaxID=183260 RepID=A0ABR2RX35_9ROSI